MNRISKCMAFDMEIEKVNLELNEIMNLIISDKKLIMHYPVSTQAKELIMNKTAIITCEEKRNDCMNIEKLLSFLLEDLMKELTKSSFLMNKKSISMLLFSLHNLPKVYLNKDFETICNINLSSITPEEAIEYSKLSMSREIQMKYQAYLR